MTAADFEQRLSRWMASKDDLARPAFALLTQAAATPLTLEECMDLMAICFAAGYLQRRMDECSETAQLLPRPNNEVH